MLQWHSSSAHYMPQFADTTYSLYIELQNLCRITVANGRDACAGIPIRVTVRPDKNRETVYCVEDGAASWSTDRIWSEQ